MDEKLEVMREFVVAAVAVEDGIHGLVHPFDLSVIRHDSLDVGGARCGFWASTFTASLPRLLDQLLSGTDAAAALQQGGLLDELKKALAERALNAEIDHHLSGEAGVGNSRNGYGRKTVLTDTGGRIALEVPRDRQDSFDPQLIAKYQRRFPGFDEKIVSLYARGLSDRLRKAWCDAA